VTVAYRCDRCDVYGRDERAECWVCGSSDVLLNHYPTGTGGAAHGPDYQEGEQ
jgi:hypothetical protein